MIHQILNYLYVGAVVVLLFGAAVFVHEFGHYWVARRRGLKVEAFAIGFGPKIFGWRKDGIDYSWRWIPAGGFVKLPQMVTSEALEGKAGEPQEPLPPVSPLSKILVAFAGPFMNLVFAFAIACVLYFAGLPMLVNPSTIGHVDPASPEAKLGIEEGDRIVAVNGKPTKTWQQVHEATIFALTNVIPVTIEHKGEKRTHMLEAKSNDFVGGKYLNLDPNDHPEVSMVTFGGAADAAGLKEKDVVVEFVGVKVASRDQLIGLIQKRGGQESEIVVERAKQRMAFKLTPRVDPSTKKGLIGVALTSNSVNVYEVMRPGPLPWESLMDVWNKTIDTLSALFHKKQTGVGFKDLSGPIGIFAMLGGAVNTDYRLALNFLILLNVNLAILNLLPMPVLDGGHIVMAVLEKIRRKPLSARVQENATTVFAVVLISFMVYVSWHDVGRFPLFKAMFKQENQINTEAKPAVEPQPASTNK